MKVAKYLCISLILLFVSCAEEDAMMEEEIAQIQGSAITNEIIKLVNEHRNSKGLSDLIRNATADKLADNHNAYMIEMEDINHDNFSERSAALRNDEQAKSVGENVAAGFPDAKSVVEAWLNSQGHKENIEGNFTHTGISATKNSGGTYYFTHLFYRQ